MSDTRNYDDEPVTYCPRCYSLKIGHEEITDSDVCMDCGCTEVRTTDIGIWEKLYEKRYGRKFVKKNTDPRASVFFKMSLQELKSVLYRRQDMMDIIHRLYPRFPKGLDATESVFHLFDMLCRDKRTDDLRYILYEQLLNKTNNQNDN